MNNKPLFVTYIIEELKRRKSLNSSYSLRSYSKNLNINPSVLSRIMSGKVPLSLKMFDRLSKSLPISPEFKEECYEELINCITLRNETKERGHEELSPDELKLLCELINFILVEFFSTQVGTSKNLNHMKVSNLQQEQIKKSFENFINHKKEQSQTYTLKKITLKILKSI